ncbi:hypothetical protein O0L34_g14715 [Tuta absoluta]|nr:hypothetical protein O0L34_g14715 [Tuta absoluta]
MSIQLKNSKLFGECRCCLEFGHHEEIGASYGNGVQQVYRDTFLETFNLSLSTNPILTTRICKSCIDRLMDARDFKAMVVKSEQHLLTNHSSNIEFVNVSRPGAQDQVDEGHSSEIIKHEDNYLHITLQELDHADMECSSALMTIEDTANCDVGKVKQEDIETEVVEEEEQQSADWCEILASQLECSDGADADTLHAAADELVMSSSGRKKKRAKYTPESLELALKEIRADGISIRETCRKYKIPRTTVQDRLSGRTTDELKRPGPLPVLGAPGESKVVEWLMNISKCGFPVKKNELLDTVQKILKDLELPNPFKDDRPGQTWFQSFVKRHPEITARSAGDKARARPSEQSVRLWFRNLETFLAQQGHSDLLGHPYRIFNADEISFFLCPKTGEVLAPKEYRNLYPVTSGNEADNITIMAAFNASGEQAPLMVVFPAPRPRRRRPAGGSAPAPTHWTVEHSDTGRMKSDTFFEYITNDFNTWVESNDIEKPVLLLVDGHKAHMSLALSAICEETGIILYALPPNTSHLLGAADVSVFAPLTDQWRKHKRKFLEKPEVVDKTVTKRNFCELLQELIETEQTKTNIINGFRRCGLYPFDPNVVEYTKFRDSSL